MSVDPISFYNYCLDNEVNFFVGVPDSLLKDFCLCIDENSPKENHIISANEGNAIAIASGYHLGTNKIPLVYMQNSGIGNAVNPLLSLCDSDVYSIPMIVMVGWRGEPNINDEPQHIKQGKTQIEFLKSIDCPFYIFSKDDNQSSKKLIEAINLAKSSQKPVVILIKKNYFNKNKSIKKDAIPKKNSLGRETALEIILNKLNSNSIIVSTTGKTSREIFELRSKKNQSHSSDFLTVGSMGHCSSIALGLSLSKQNKNIICIDGDGSMIMHLGSIATIAALKPRNFKHILLNNKVHESVGGQDTAARHIDLYSVVNSFSFYKMFKASSEDELIDTIDDFISYDGPSFIEINIEPGSRPDLGRPTIEPVQNKINFMKFLEE